jgi:hypothetical protein
VHTLGGPTNSDPVLFILCNWGSQFSYEPNSLAYYNNLWIDPTSDGYHSLADYFNQVSFGQTNINGSEILDGPNSNNGWYSMSGGSSPTSLVSWGTGARVSRVTDCMNAASADITTEDLNHFVSVVTVTPQVETTAPGAITVGQTSIQVESVTDWPTAPFVVFLGSNFTAAYVTAVNSSTDTLTIGTMPNAPAGTQPGATAAFPAGTSVTSETSDDFGSGPQNNNDICDNGGVFAFGGSGTCYSFGYADVTAGDPAHGTITEGVGDLVHEVGHSFGLVHSRTLASSNVGYRDCWDQLSFDSCNNTQPNTEAVPQEPITGLDAINLEAEGWIPTASQDQYSSGQQTVNIHSISDTDSLDGGASPTLDMHIPFSVPIEDGAPTNSTTSAALPSTWPATCAGSAPSGYTGSYQCVNSDYMTVEYRQGKTPSGEEDWDYGAGGGCDAPCWAGLTGYVPTPGNAVVLHLHAPTYPSGPYSFLMNLDPNASSIEYLPDDGGLSPSFGSAADQFADFATNTYLGVNSLDPNTWTATVTVSDNPIISGVSVTGAVDGSYGQTVTLSGALLVSPGGAPVPNEPITFSVGSQSCIGTTDNNGDASCTITLNQTPGNTTLTERFDGSEAYAAESTTVPFTIIQAPLTVTANNASRDYGQANPSFSAVLRGFVNGQDLPTSDVTGSADCTTTAGLSSAPGPYPITCTTGSLTSSDYSFGPFEAGTLTINKAPQTITFNPLANKLFGTAPFTVSASSSSGLPVSFTSTTLSACSVTASGSSLTVLQPGTCTVLASQAGDADYLAATPVTQSFTVGFSSPCIVNQHGTLTVTAGQAICLSGGTVNGGVIVKAGGALWLSNATVHGAITSTGANAVTLCGAKLSGGPTITGTTGLVNIGGASCANRGNAISGSVTITNNTGGVTFSNNSVNGSVTITNNSGGFTYASNTLTGTATLTNNT